MPSRVRIAKEEIPEHHAHRWVVRDNHGELYGYAFSWWGAWRLACHAVGWKVPT